MSMSPCHALLRLVLAGGRIGPRRRLLDSFEGDAEAALAAGVATWRAAGLDDAPIARLRGHDPPLREVESRTRAWLAHPGHALIGWNHADYPPLLRQIASPPLGLFIEGEAGRLWHPQIAIVGSRGATAGGTDNARHFARAFAQAGFAVTSGLAAGIDAAAHHGALAVEGGLTVAVLATGPDLAYPAAHAPLRDAIAERGVLVSEHAPGTPAIRRHFPTRNRLIAGLALGTLVVEAAERSGALISARMAADAGREVFALPGSIHNPMARGCHQLLRDGAQLVESPDDVLHALAGTTHSLCDALHARLGKAAAATDDPALSSANDPNRLWEALGHDPIPMDVLASRTGLTVAELSPMLLALELQGRLAVEHGRYTRKSA